MEEWISITLLLGSTSNFATGSVAEIESLNITDFSKDPVLPELY
jgi:hypothetical protein